MYLPPEFTICYSLDTDFALHGYNIFNSYLLDNLELILGRSTLLESIALRKELSGPLE